MTDFNSGNIDPSKVNPSHYNQDKKGKPDKEELPAKAEEAPTVPMRFNPVDAGAILDFMAKNSALNMSGVEQAGIGQRIAQFASFISPSQHAELMRKFRGVVDEEVNALGLSLSEAARNELAELSLANYAIGAPVVRKQ